MSQPKSPDPSDPTNLGNLLLRMRAVEAPDLAAALVVQEDVAGASKVPLGLLLSEAGCVSSADVATALELQRRFRGGEAGQAALDLMDRDLEALKEGERRIREAIEESAETSGSWLRSPTP